MKIIGLLFLGLLAFAVTSVWKFPAAGVLPHVNIEPVKLSGVSGSVWNGSAQQVIGPDPQLPPVHNVNWKFQPSALLAASAGANIDFEVLGGTGKGLVRRNLAGDVMLTDGKLQIPATNLEQFLPLPVAEFAGVLLADIEELELENNLLKRTQGKVVWSNAEIIDATKLGQVVFDIVPEGDLHMGKLSNTGGELTLRGEVTLDQAGNFKADIQIKPTPQTPAHVDGILKLIGRPASDGSYRIRNNGNIHDYL